jgi:predicted ferric reductase
MTLVEWYVARSGGMVAFALLTLAVIAGLTLSGRARLPRWPRFAVEDVHRFLGLLTGTFVFIHVFALFIDAYLPFSLTELLVPGAASYRPFATALGVVGLELMMALTNKFKNRLSYRFWRKAHYLNFAVWLLSLAHGVLSGTDTGAFWADLLYVLSGASVIGLLTWRVLAPQAQPATS